MCIRVLDAPMYVVFFLFLPFSVRRFNAGRASRIGLTTFSALGGALFGLSRAVSHVTKAIPELPPNSQCKILARKVSVETNERIGGCDPHMPYYPLAHPAALIALSLILHSLAERYPLAMAEAIDDFEKKQSKP